MNNLPYNSSVFSELQTGDTFQFGSSVPFRSVCRKISPRCYEYKVSDDLGNASRLQTRAIHGTNVIVYHVNESEL